MAPFLWTSVRLREAGRGLHHDAAGLTLLAYALGAAAVILPLAIALAFFALGTAADLTALLDCPATPADPALENADDNAAFNLC